MPNPSELARLEEEEYERNLEKSRDLSMSKSSREYYLQLARNYENERMR